jgi:hypothetical protein
LPRATGPDGKFSSIWRQVMTKKTRKRYSAEFKAAAVARLEAPHDTLSA